MGKKGKSKRRFLKKKLPKLIGIFTVVITSIAFCIRGFYYLYEWGYYNAIGVNRIYIDVEGLGTIYYVIANLGLAALLIISNYFTYVCWTSKKKLHIGFLLILEYIAFFGVIFASSNINFLEYFRSLFTENGQESFLLLSLKVFLIIFVFNLYGIYVGIKKKKEIQDKIPIDNLKEAIIFFILVIILEGAITYFIGMSSGHDRKDYKVILENIEVEREGNIEDKYVFTIENRKVRLCPILYENNEIYIISYLCRDNQKVFIDNVHQKIISKVDVETLYFENIFTFNEEQRIDNVESIELTQKRGVEQRMDSLVGAIIGAVFGSLGTYFIEFVKRNKEKKALESHAASILYHDLKSIEQYLREEKQFVNLRYSQEWQNMVTDCFSLDDESIMYLYKIYDEVYNYNASFVEKSRSGKKFQKRKLVSYKKLNRLLFDLKKNGNENVAYSIEFDRLMKKLGKIKDGIQK